MSGTLSKKSAECVRATLNRGAQPGWRISGSPRLLYIANVAWFFRSHRLPIALEAMRSGFDVHLAAAFQSEEERRQFEDLGIITHPVPFERSGTAVIAEAQVVHKLRRLLVQLRPALCHNVSIKPVIYGGGLARVYGIPAVNAISGLGYSYIAQGLKAHLRRELLNRAYSWAVNSACSRIIVQNDDDYRFFNSELKVSEQRLVLINGSGVDLRLFNQSSRVTNTMVVLPARMLADKGVREFSAAAGMLRTKYPTARFVLVGGLDEHNRAGLSRREINDLVATGAVEYWGHRTDIPDVLAAAQIVCLPSYREGFPKALLEAAAARRAIVATDVPGCREIVRHGVNGLLVPPRNAELLSCALDQLLADRGLCERMGQEGRQLVETHFSLDIVVSRTMAVYRELLP